MHSGMETKCSYPEPSPVGQKAEGRCIRMDGVLSNTTEEHAAPGFRTQTVKAREKG